MLNVQTEHLENHTARLTVEVDPERLEQAMRKTARRVSQKGRIPGFRPGKAPYNIILNMYGREFILGETLDTLGNEIYREALENSDIEPYAPGTLENIDEEDGLKLIFVVPKRPEVDLGNYRDIRVDVEVPEVTDEMVNEAMENLRQNQALLEPADRPAQVGDQVTFSHIVVVALGAEEAGTVEADDEADDAQTAADEAVNDGSESVEPEDASEAEEEDSGEETILHQHDFDRVLRDDDNDLFPGFSAEIVGMAAGDEKAFTLDIPAENELELVAGKTLRCEVTLGKVQARTVPEWSDELAKRVSQEESETILDLRVNVRKELENEAQRIADQGVLEQALEQLVEGATAHYPEELVDEHLDDLMEEIDQNMRQQGLALKDFLTITGRTEDDLRNEYRDRADSRARRALALSELIRREELAVTDEDIEHEIDRITQYWGGEEAGQFRQYLTTDQSRRNVSLQLLSDRALGRLVAIAKGEDPAIGPDKPASETDAVESDQSTPSAEVVEESAPAPDAPPEDESDISD